MKKNTITVLTLSEMIKVKNRIQREACIAIVKEWAKNKGLDLSMKAILNLATGVGKTRTSHKLIFEYLPEVQSILFMVPKISLVDQTITEWRARGIEFEYATFYCDGDISTVEDIQWFMNKPTNKKKVIFAVYNSVGETEARGKSNLTLSGVEFDLAIYDECHRAAGKEYGMFTSCAQDHIVSAKRKLFMTATVKEYFDDVDEETNQLIEDRNEFSMANTDIFGEVAYSLNIFEAIRLGILCDFQTYLLEIADDDIKKMLNTNLTFLGEDVKGRHLATAYSVVKIYNQGARKIVVAYREKQDAHDFNTLFNFMQRELGLLKGATLGCVASDATPSQLGAPTSYINENGDLVRINTNRKAQQWWLKYGPFCTSENAVATTSPWLKEGEDVPCIDCIVFGDRFTSGIDIIQMIGRALRWYEGKTMARIVLPITEGEANKAARQIRETVGSLTDNVNEVQIVVTKGSPSTLAPEPGPGPQPLPEPGEGGDTDPEPTSGRWVFEDDTVDTTTLEINQGEMTVEVIHSNEFTPESRVTHDQMYEVVSLQMTGKYKRYLIEERARKFIDQALNQIQENVNNNTYNTKKRRMRLNDEYYFQQYADTLGCSIEQGKKELVETGQFKRIEEYRNSLIKNIF